MDAGNEDFAFNHVDILILLGSKDEAYRDLKKLLDAGCQPGRLQGFYARLKKKKK
ncbi:TPR repeat domain exported protein [human gut metagenome]|uniref:TPR repeat domain exported protein n=1 Tax=human gut metagenome TaxID=408170 RepID=K1SIZ9_9ZZZZ